MLQVCFGKIFTRSHFYMSMHEQQETQIFTSINIDVVRNEKTTLICVLLYCSVFLVRYLQYYVKELKETLVFPYEG